MRSETKLLYLILMLLLPNCKEIRNEPPTQDEPSLTVDDFTVLEDIDPSIYIATPENMAKDPNNLLMEMFRKKKASDMANDLKPRPFKKNQIGSIENISHEQTWAPITDIFKFKWSDISSAKIESFSRMSRARMIFDNADLKVTELALAPDGIIPLHAQATPSVFFILGGEGIVTSDSLSAKVYTGTSIKFDSYSKKKIKVTSKESLKILWFSWAPEGAKSYLESGYYLTGSFPHIQTINAVLPDTFDFWNATQSQKYQLIQEDRTSNNISDNFKHQNRAWDKLIKTNYYPETPIFKSGIEVDWVDLMNMDPKSFFFADDLKSLGSTMEMMSKLAKIKSVFRVVRPDGGYDLNYSYLAWGPQSKYITHSHAICEFYYILEGDVEYIINGEEYHGVPGNFYFHPPYYDHEMRGLQKDVPFLSISGSWIPFGQRGLFDLSFLLLEDITEYSGAGFPEDFDFHDFGIKREGVVFGEL